MTAAQELAQEQISDEILEIYASEFEDGRDNFDLRAKLLKRGIPWGMVATLLRELQRRRSPQPSPDVAEVVAGSCNVGNHTLTVTHVFDGEEVVTGGEDGQAWVATFADPVEAKAYVRFRQDWSWMVGALRNRPASSLRAPAQGETTQGEAQRPVENAVDARRYRFVKKHGWPQAARDADGARFWYMDRVSDNVEVRRHKFDDCVDAAMAPPHSEKGV